MPLRGRNNFTEERYFFVTTTVVRFLDIFADPEICHILIRNIKFYQAKYKFTILAYVIMPSHFHWIIEIEPSLGTISNIMRDLKSHSSRDILEYLSNEQKLQKIFKSEAAIKYKQKRKLWMDSFDDQVIRGPKMFWTKLTYIHQNPVEAGLVLRAEEYPFSSARNYTLQDHSIIFVDTTQAGVIIS